jgi:hypothetical protein
LVSRFASSDDLGHALGRGAACLAAPFENADGGFSVKAVRKAEALDTFLSKAERQRETLVEGEPKHLGSLLGT